MPQRIIIIRGNSGSGKSTVAARVRDALGERTMFLQQDVLRRGILKARDKAGNPVIGLIKELALYGKRNGYDVVLEGILAERKYGDMLRGLLSEFDESYVYYMDISFEETLRRHSIRHKNNDFGEAEMREWWQEKDYLGINGERTIGEELTEDESTNAILEDIQESRS